MKKKPNRRKLLLMLSVGIIYVVYILISQQIQMFKFNKQIRTNNEKIVSEQKVIDELNKTKQTYKSDEFIEKMARERLGYVKVGEKVYIDRSNP